MTRASSAAEQLLKSLEGPLEVVLGAPYGERAISCLKQSRLAAAVCVLLVVLLTLAAGAVASGSSAKKKPDNSDPVHYDVSPPLRDMTPATPPPADPKKDKEPKKGLPVPGQSSVPDPVVQTTPGADAAPPVGTGFEGVGQGFSGPNGSFLVTSAPPDPNATVGPNHIVEIVNQSFAVFNKSGTPTYGPVATNTLWSGFGGGCEWNDDGDGTVVYGKLADRWILQQFSVSTTPYLECIAVSTSGDPTGS